jgi:hypothetical protein
MPDNRPTIIAKRPPRRIRAKKRIMPKPKSGRTAKPKMHGIPAVLNSPQAENDPAKA